MWRDKEGTTWLVWNLTDRTTAPRPISDEEWKYRISIDPSIEKNSQENIEKAVKNWLKKEAKKQAPPEGDWKFWIDASGNLHKRGEE